MIMVICVQKQVWSLLTQIAKYLHLINTELQATWLEEREAMMIHWLVSLQCLCPATSHI